MAFGQLSAACLRCASVIVTCARCSASANVAGVTAGPTDGALAKVGGAPGVAGAAPAVWPLALGDGVAARSRQATATLSKPKGARIRNRRREFTWESPMDVRGATRMAGRARGRKQRL